MRLYRLGDEGTAVGDIQDRLADLGYRSGHDERSTFGEGTFEAVSAFQNENNLGVDGIVGPETWRFLYEAGYRLGDRLLFYRRPMIRGEDVSELQSRLNSLGFDSGNVDGIFGPDTERAVIEFQHNRDLAEDGKGGPSVTVEIRLITRGEMKEGRQAVREREWLRRLPTTVAGSRIYLDAGCRDPGEARGAWDAATATALCLQDVGALPVLSRSQDITLPERLRARRANRLGSDLIIAFQVAGNDAGRVFYFASPHSKSEAGEQLATAVAKAAGGQVEGRASAILKETRAPSIVVSRAHLDASIGAPVVSGLVNFFANAASTR